MTEPPKDPWEVGTAYEPYVGRWSRRIAREFVGWLGVPDQATWVDVGCGTGALMEEILASADPRAVHGVDASGAFVEYARRRVSDLRAKFRVGDAQSLPQADGSADAVVSGLVINFVPDPSRAVVEMSRVAVPGGMIGAYVWDYGGRMDLIRYFWNAATDVDPDAAALDEARRFPMCTPGSLEKLFLDAGLRDVSARAIDVPTRFRNFDDFWTPFLGGAGPAPFYAMSLGEDRRAAVRERLRTIVPTQPDGSIDLIARAWAVKGRR